MAVEDTLPAVAVVVLTVVMVQVVVVVLVVVMVAEVMVVLMLLLEQVEVAEEEILKLKQHGQVETVLLLLPFQLHNKTNLQTVHRLLGDPGGFFINRKSLGIMTRARGQVSH